MYLRLWWWGWNPELWATRQINASPLLLSWTPRSSAVTFIMTSPSPKPNDGVGPDKPKLNSANEITINGAEMSYQATWQTKIDSGRRLLCKWDSGEELHDCHGLGLNCLPQLMCLRTAPVQHPEVGLWESLALKGFDFLLRTNDRFIIWALLEDGA